MPVPYTQLTPRQQDALRVVIDHVERLGVPPTIVEVSAALGLSHVMAGYAYLNALEAKGYVRRRPGVPRGLVVLRGLDGKALLSDGRKN